MIDRQWLARIASSLTFALSIMLLHGCVWAPGQHVSGSDFVRKGESDSSKVELIPITPTLLASDHAAQLQETMPPILLDYQPPPYTIGAGDSLFITVWDHPELTAPAGANQPSGANGRLVRSDGTLFYPYVGTLKVSGMTIEHLREIISSKLATYIKKPQVDVSVVGYNSQRVLVGGAFMKTDPLPITAVPLTLAQALGTATINTQEANLSGLVLRRDGHDYHLDLDALNNQHHLARNIYLAPGDRLFLGYNDRQQVYVMGEVLRPQALTFKTANLSLTQALGQAGGLNEITAKGKAVYVIRGANDMENTKAKVFQLNARSPVAFVLADQFKVKPGDVVFVGPAGVTRWNRFLSQLLPLSGLLNSVSASKSSFGY